MSCPEVVGRKEVLDGIIQHTVVVEAWDVKAGRKIIKSNTFIMQMSYTALPRLLVIGIFLNLSARYTQLC